MRTDEEIEAELDRLTTESGEYDEVTWERYQATRATLRWVLGLDNQSPIDAIRQGYE